MKRLVIACCLLAPGFVLAQQGVAICGNGVLEGGELCDDGNLSDGDACPSTCGVLPAVSEDPAPPEKRLLDVSPGGALLLSMTGSAASIVLFYTTTGVGPATAMALTPSIGHLYTRSYGMVVLTSGIRLATFAWAKVALDRIPPPVGFDFSSVGKALDVLAKAMAITAPTLAFDLIDAPFAARRYNQKGLLRHQKEIWNSLTVAPVFVPASGVGATQGLSLQLRF